MKGFDVLHVKSAVKQRNKFDLSRTHLTTMDFGQIVPLLSEETVPGDKFSISADYFSRMAPLATPTYGRFSFKTVSAFVPYHQIAVDADAWFAGKTSWEGQTPVQRTFNVSQLFQFLNSTGISDTGTQANADFSYITSAGAVSYRKFTKAGRYYAKVLNALGYAIPQGVDQQTTSVWYTTTRSTKLSAMPLLAFFKVYNDYMSQSQRFNTSQLSSALYKIKYGIQFSGYTPSTGAMTYQVLSLLFSNLFLNYENDYFVSAWQNPNAALAGFDDTITVDVPGNTAQQGGSVTHNLNDTLLNVTGNAAIQVSIGQRALDFLRSFDDWVRRNNYSGSRAVQQIYSRFGIKTDDYKSHYANVISTDIMPIQVGDVTSTADTTDAKLGEYAGKGIMSGSKSIDVSVSDYGLVLILGYFTVAPMMAYGYDRKVLRTTPLDYYNPEFDGIGADAISLGEVYASPLAIADGDTTQDNQVFGYTERYNAYRYGRDQITGDFRDYHVDGDMNAWHTGRNLSTIRKEGNLVAQSTAVNTLPQTDSEYNRIFSVTDGVVDHFYMTCRFSVDAIRPMLNLNQVVKLGEGDTSVPRNGNVIS